VVCSYLNNLEQGQTETAHAIRELISKPLSSMIAILDKQGVKEGGRLETPASCQGVEFSSQACPERSRSVS
jgi:hypothetical protein